MPRVLEGGIHAAAPTRKWRVDLVLQRLALVGVIVAIWWIISLGLPHFIMPGPPRVMQALASLSGSGDLWHNLAITLGRVAAGWIPGLDIKPILDELKARVAEELDYGLEADAQARFAAAFRYGRSPRRTARVMSSPRSIAERTSR